MNGKISTHTRRLPAAVLAMMTVVMLGAPAAQADTLHATDDATVFLTGKKAKRNYGKAPVLVVNSKGSGQQVFLKFDTSLLSGTSIDKATLRLWVSKVRMPGELEVQLVDSAWLEGQITGNSKPSTTPLTLRVPIGATDVRKFVTIDLTTEVQDWLDFPSDDFGIVLMADPSTGVIVSFDSKENVKTSHQPEIEVVSSLEVGGGEILPDSVTSSHIVDGEVYSVDIRDDTITDIDIRANSVGSSELGPNAVFTGHIAYRTITTDDIANNAVGSGQIIDNEVRSEDIRDDTITAFDLAANSVGSSEVSNDSLSSQDLAANSVGQSEIQTGAVASSEVQNESLTALDLAPDSVGASEIATNAVGQSEIQTGGVASSEVQDNTLTSFDLASDSVWQDEIGHGAVGASEIATGAVGTSEVANDSLTAADLAANSVGTSEIANGAVRVADLSNDAKGFGIGGVTVVHPFEFVPLDWTEQYVRSASGGYVRPGVSSGFGITVNTCMRAPVHLPDGVVVRDVTAVVRDNNASWFIGNFKLRRTDLFSNSTSNTNVMATVIMGALNSPDIARFSSASVSTPTVDAARYSYSVDFCATHSDHRIYGVIIYY